MVLVLRTLGESQARYYLQGPATGRWVGAGSPSLGLTGSVDARSLRAVLAGRDPAGPPLLPARVDHRAGFDLIMATPKSVSLLAALAPLQWAGQLTAAHDQAVAAALGYLERNAAWTRRGRANERIPTEGLIAGAFGHRWSGAGDPHLHTHVVLANLVRGDDGRWSCLDSRALYRHAGAAGAVFQASLRDAVAEAGFNFRWNVSPEGLGDIAGVPRAAIDAASLRHHQVTEEVRAGLAGRKGRVTAAGRTRSRLPPDRNPTWDVRVASAGLDQKGATNLIERAVRPEQVIRHQPVAPPHGLTAGVLSERSSSFQRQDVVRAVAGLASTGASAPLLEQWADDFLATALPAGDRTWTTVGLRRLEERITSLAIDARRPAVGLARDHAPDAVLGLRTDLTATGQAAVRRLTTGGARVELVRGDLISQAWVLDAARSVWEVSGHRVALVSPTERGAARWQALAGIGLPPTPPAHASVMIVDGADRWPTQALHRMISDADARSAKLVILDGGTTPPRRRAESPAFETLRARLPAIDCDGSVQARLAATVPAATVPAATVPAPTVPAPTAGAVGLRTGNDGRITVTASGPAAAELLIQEWHRAQADCAGTRMVALGPEEAEYLNGLARLVRRAAGELAGPALEVAGRSFQVADQVMLLRGNATPGSVGRGSIGTVVGVDDHNQLLTIRWPDRPGQPEQQVMLSAAALSAAPLTHGYATTPAYLRAGNATPVLALGDPARLTPGLEPNQIFTVAPAPRLPNLADPVRDLLAELQHRVPATSQIGPPAEANRPLAELWAERDRLASRLRAAAPPDRRPELRRVGEERDWLQAVPRAAGRPERMVELDDRVQQLAAAVDSRARWLEAHRDPLERWDQLSTAIAWREHALGLGAESRPSQAVLAELGPAPADANSRQAWRQAAGAIEAYRERWGLPDQPLALSPTARGPGQTLRLEPMARRSDELRVVASCRAVRQARGRDRGLSTTAP